MEPQNLEGIKPVEITENQQLYFVNGQSYGVVDRQTHNLTNDTHHRKITIGITSDNRKDASASTTNYGVVSLTEQKQVVASINLELADPMHIAQMMADCMQIISQTLNEQ